MMRDIQNREIERLAIAGTPPQQIAARMGCAVEMVHAAISRARRAGCEIPHFPRTRSPRPVEAASRTVVISADVLDALGEHARARGVTVNKLVRELLAVIADDNLTPAILDDQE